MFLVCRSAFQNFIRIPAVDHDNYARQLVRVLADGIGDHITALTDIGNRSRFVFQAAAVRLAGIDNVLILQNSEVLSAP